MDNKDTHFTDMDEHDAVTVTVTVMGDDTYANESELATAVLCMWLRRWQRGHEEELLKTLERDPIRDVNPYGECWRCSGCSFNSYEMSCDCKVRGKSVGVIEYSANLLTYHDRFEWDEFKKLDGKRKYIVPWPENHCDHLTLNPVREWAWKFLHDDETALPRISIGTINDIRRKKGIVEKVSYPDGTVETEDQQYARIMASLHRT